MPRHAVRRFLILLALALPLADLAAPPAAQAAPSEFIRRFHSDITVHADGSMDVRETIEVRSAGVSIRRGIYRDFPLKYQDRWGNRMVVGFKALGAKRDGHPEKFRTDSRQNGVRIYLGDPDKLLDPGDYTYELAYQTNRQIGFFADHDELYWNVTGTGWTFLIYEAAADVHLPSPVPTAVLRMEGYTGPQGSREQAIQSESPGPGRAVFRASRPLGAYEGLTIVLSFPKGVVKPPSRADKGRYFVQDNKPILGGLRRAWLVAAPPGLAPLVLDLTPEPVWLTDIEVSSQVALVNGRVVSGFTGRLRFACDAAPEVAAAVDRLVRLAPYSGVGAYTTRGFGTVRVESAPRRRDTG